MSSYKLGILGPFSGKTGPVVGASWKGKPVMRAVPAIHTDAKTDAQLTQRQKFSLIQKFLAHARDFVNIGFADYKENVTARNSALSYNVNAALVGSYPDVSIDYEAIMLSRGRLRGPKGVSITQEPESDIVVNWTPLSGKTNAQNTDQVMVMMYNQDQDEAEVYLNEGNRGDLSVSIEPFEDYTGQTVHIWIAFRSESGKLITDSVYAGAHVVV